MEKVNKYLIGLLLRVGISACVLDLGCSPESTQLAGGSDTEICGSVVNSEGKTVCGASVTLIPSSFNPAFDVSLTKEMTDITNENGAFDFKNVKKGEYNLLTVYSEKGTQTFDDGISVNGERKIFLDDQELKETAKLILPLTVNNIKTPGYIYIPGTPFSKHVETGAVRVEFDSIPRGNYRTVLFQISPSNATVTLFTNIFVNSNGDFYIDPYVNWTNQALITLNTTSTGADIGDTLLDFPILVRLTSVNIDFSTAKKNGEDLRICKSDFTPLDFEIERWDSSSACAEIWIKADTIYGNDSTRFLIMRWGNPKASSLSQPGAVFDTSEGFTGVWHFDGSGLNPSLDATFNKFTATPYNMTGSSDVEGVIGRAMKFDGISNYITVENSTTGKLDSPSDGYFTISAWIYSDAANSGTIISKGSTYGLRLNESHEWQFFFSLPGQKADSTTAAGTGAGGWTFITGVNKGNMRYLYVDGVIADSSIGSNLPSQNPSTDNYALFLGRQAEAGADWFKGLIDEVRISNRSCSAEWIKLCYQNQRSDQKFIKIKKQ